MSLSLVIAPVISNNYKPGGCCETAGTLALVPPLAATAGNSGCKSVRHFSGRDKAAQEHLLHTHSKLLKKRRQHGQEERPRLFNITIDALLHRDDHVLKNSTGEDIQSALESCIYALDNEGDSL